MQLVSDQRHVQLSPPQQLMQTVSRSQQLVQLASRLQQLIQHIPQLLMQHASQQHRTQLASDQQLMQRTSPAYATASDQQPLHLASQQSMQPASQQLLHLASQQLSQFASASKQLTHCSIDTLSCSLQCSLQGCAFNTCYYHCSASGGAVYTTAILLEDARPKPAVLAAVFKCATLPTTSKFTHTTTSKFAGGARSNVRMRTFFK